MKISLNAAYAISRVAGVTGTIMLGLFIYAFFDRTLGEQFLFYPNVLLSIAGVDGYSEALTFPGVMNLLSGPVPIVFIISLILSMRGSLGGRFVWLGSLVCFVTIAFLNTILLFRIDYPFISELTFLSAATLVLSILAFIGGFLSLEPRRLANNMVLTYGKIVKRRGWTILYFLLKTLGIPYMCFTFTFLLFDPDLPHVAKLASIIIICGILLLYSIYIVAIVLLRQSHPMSYVLTPILLSMDFVPCNFPYSLTSIFAVILFVLFMRDMKKGQETGIDNP